MVVWDITKKNKQTNHAQKKENQEAHLSCRPCGAKTRNLLRNFEKGYDGSISKSFPTQKDIRYLWLLHQSGLQPDLDM